MSDSENDDTEPKTDIRVQGGDIYFYCDVTRESVRDLMTQIRKLEIEMATAMIKVGLDDTPRIRIHISSNGGCLYSGLAIFDYLRSTQAHITTIAEGCCASAATLILLGGDVCTMGPSAYLLIHQLGTAFWGKYEDLKDELAHCDQLMKTLKKIYLRETKIPEKKLDKLMKRDLYLSYRKCVKYGVVSGN